MKKAIIEILYEGEVLFGSPTYGDYLVREFDEEGEEEGGSIHKTIEEAEAHVRKYQEKEEEE